MNSKVKLWAIHDLDFWLKLKAEKELYTNPCLSPHIGQAVDENLKSSFIQAYDWIRLKMKEHVPNYKGHYPFWFWDNKKAVDLRFWRHFYRPGDWVRIEIEVETDRCLFTHFDGFACGVLNGNFVALNEEEHDSFYAQDKNDDTSTLTLAQIRELLTNDEYVSDGPDWYAEHEPQIKASWERILDLELMNNSEYFGKGYAQVNIEELKLSDVTKTTHFKGIYKEKIRK